MEEKTTIDKIREIEEEEKKNDEFQQSLYIKAERLRKKKANLILQHFKEKKIFSLMTWTYRGSTWGSKVNLQAKEDWNKCPEEIVSLLSPDYHDHFYFHEMEEEIDEIETGVKMGLHFDDGDIYLSLEIDEKDDRNKMIDFLKRHKMKIDAKEINEEIKELQKELEGKEKIIKFSEEVNGK